MRVTDKLIADAKRRKDKSRRLPEDEEETYTYRPVERYRAVNAEPGVFGSVMGKGINTRRSVFDDTAVFNTGTDTGTKRTTR